MARRSTSASPVVCLTLAAAFWAVGTVISKALLASVSPITFLAIQLVPSVAVLWALVLIAGIPPAGWRVLLPVALLGWVNPGLSYTLSMLGLARSIASVATLLSDHRAPAAAGLRHSDRCVATDPAELHLARAGGVPDPLGCSAARRR